MRFLSLCADSARPPGLTTHHKPTMNTTNQSTSVQRQCETSLTCFYSNAEMYLPTAYYKHTKPPPCITPHSLPTHQSVPLSYNTSHTPMASLHAISALPNFTLSWQFLFLVIFTIANVLPTQLKKQRAQKRINKHCTPKRCRKKYPMSKPPGTRPKTGKINTTWNVVYDPSRDQVLEWRSNRVRIYKRSKRGHRLFTYHKGKHENTFPRQALPIYGTWNGSDFIVNHVSHWMDSPTATHTNGTTQSDNQKGQATKAKITSVVKQSEKRHGPATRAKTPAPITKRKIPNGKAETQTEKVSHMSNEKWHPQVRHFITKWTSQQMDAYLAIPEVALEWIVDPG